MQISYTQWQHSPLLMAGHRQVNSRISKGSQNILIYNFIITAFNCQGGGITPCHRHWLHNENSLVKRKLGLHDKHKRSRWCINCHLVILHGEMDVITHPIIRGVMAEEVSSCVMAQQNHKQKYKGERGRDRRIWRTSIIRGVMPEYKELSLWWDRTQTEVHNVRRIRPDQRDTLEC